MRPTPERVDVSYRIVSRKRRRARLGNYPQSKAPGAKDPDASIRGRTLRLASLRKRAIGLQLLRFEIEEGGVEITLETSFDGLNLGLVAERLDGDIGCGARTAPASVSPCDLLIAAGRRP